MTDVSAHRFFQAGRSLSIAEIAALTGGSPRGALDQTQTISDIAPVDLAGREAVTFVAEPRYAAALAGSQAGLVLTTQRLADAAPSALAVLICKKPYEAFVRVAHRLYPQALRPASLFGATGIAPNVTLHQSATLGDNVTIDPGAVIGPGARIGSGTVIGANAVIGADTVIGRDCAIGPNATVSHAVLGDRVIIHAGAQIGQDGYGYVSDASGHTKVPQIGSVRLHDDVEIGANSTVDRGGIRDTVIGQGTKIDNLVQIGHNCVIGEHCIIVSQSGLSGSVTVGDYAILGARVGAIPHVTIGERAMLAARSSVITDIPAGATWGGFPARPMREWLRELAARQRAGKKASAKSDDAG